MNKSTLNLFILTLAIFAVKTISFAQCSFTGLDATYCLGDPNSTLVGDPAGGIFSGTGIAGSTFDPSLAGPGVHTITYELAGGGTGDKYYIKSAGAEPWWGTSNPDAMNAAFGADWTMEAFETAVVATVFSPTTGFVFIDGSDSQASELATFLAANLTAIEAWVNAGGRLLLNSAPNEGGNIVFGFGGVLLNYTAFDYSLTHIWDITVLDVAYPALVGPLVPTSSAMSGTYYGHATITGGGCTPIAIETGNPSKVVLAEKCWGSGRVMFGGMTTHNFHSPAPNAGNWRSNLFTYLYNNACGGGCTVTQEVEVFADPSIGLTVDDIEICEGEDVVFTATGGDTYTFDVGGITSGVPYFPPAPGTFEYTVTGTDAVSGCQNTAMVEVVVNLTPNVTATADDLEVCLGDNMTLTGGGAATYVWDMGVTNGVPFSPGPLGSITYTVIGTTAEGCVDEASITITVIDCEPVDAGFVMDNNICVGDCITLTDTSIGTTIVTYEWDFGAATDPSTSLVQNPTVCFTIVGTFDISLTITSLYGRVSTEIKSITVNALPTVVAKLDTIIDLGGDANLIATTAVIDGIYSWLPDEEIECSNCQVTTASPLDSTTYTVYLTDENGCKANSSMVVYVNFIEAVGVPSAFSPNGDGSNDVLFVKGLGLAAVNLVIYNRYGEVVFETFDQNIGWDGTFKNKDENPGVFTWVLYYDYVTGKKGMIKGNTTLIR
jgi:gliding motility-associated-like protein